MVKISVIVLANDSANNLKKCMDSIVNQTFKDIEIICIAEGLTDSSLKTLNEFSQDSRVKILDSQNEGVPYNNAMKHCLGDYIFFCDSEDIISEKALERLHDSAVSNNSDFVIFKSARVQGDSVDYDKSIFNFDDVNVDFTNFTFDHLDVRENVLNNSFAPWTKFYKKQFLEKYNLEFSDISSFNEILFHVQSMIKASRISFVPECLYFYRLKNDKSINRNESKLMNIFKSIDAIEEFLKAENLLEEYGHEFDYFKIVQINKYIKNPISKMYFKTAKRYFNDIDVSDNPLIGQNELDKYEVVLDTPIERVDDFNRKLKLKKLETKHENLVEENERLNEELKHQEDMQKEILNSTSWKITKPLRFIKNFSIMNPILKRSNSFKYYNNAYESQKNIIKSKNKKIDNLQKQLKEKENAIKFLQKEGKNKDKIISNKQEEIDEYQRLNSSLENRVERHFPSHVHQDIKDINIAYVLSAFPVHSQTFIVSEVKWLVEQGYNVVVFTRHYQIKSTPIDFEVENKLYRNLDELEELLIEYDIDMMHTHFVYPICTNYTYPMAEKLKIPFTVFAHAYDIFVHENDQNNRLDEISRSRYCFGIFTLSEFHKNYLVERDVLEEKIIITKQATSYEIMPFDKKENKIKKIISISRFVEKKGLDILIDTAKILEDEDYEFSIYGYGNLEADLQNQIDELGCKNISIKGELPPDEVKNVLMDADLLVSPCKVAKNGDMDGFPTVIFESMAVGLPILTTSVSAIPEIIEDGVNGFITEPENPEKLAEKINEISNVSSEKLYEIRKRAQREVKDISSVEKTMNKYVDTIQSVI